MHMKYVRSPLLIIILTIWQLINNRISIIPKNSLFLNILVVLAILNAILGTYMLNWAWKQIKPIREQDEARDSQFPPFRRTDLKNWSLFKFYLGAITVLPIRFVIGAWVQNYLIKYFDSVIFIVICLVLFIFFKIVCIGHSFENDAPVQGWRKRVIAVAYKVMSTLLLRCGLAIKVDYKYVKYDYSKYLGSDYLKTQKFPNNISTYVSNHVSWSDIIVFLNVKQPAFASKVELKRIPVFGFLCQALGCIFIERGGTKEAKDYVIHQIQERQEAIEKEGLYPPMIVFPEGGTSNGVSILPFKKGAFASFKAVRPVFLRYDSAGVSPAYDVMPFLPLYMLQCCSFNFTCTFTELPPFIPNEYLFKTFAQAGKENWEIYADAVRDIIGFSMHLINIFYYGRCRLSKERQFITNGQNQIRNPPWLQKGKRTKENRMTFSILYLLHSH